MDPLIITVAVDSSVSYPGNAGMPLSEDTDAIGQQYIDALLAGATVAHLHGVRHLENKIQSDGRKVSKIDFDGWKRLTEKVRTIGTNPIIQFGIAAARLPDKVKLMDLQPDMMSYAFNAHDEFFQPDPAYPANEIYSLHTRDELREFCKSALARNVKTEVECFYTGAYFNLDFIRSQELLANPVWATIFLGWGGGSWSPPTPDALLFMVRHLPEHVNWNLSVMDPSMQWKLIPLAIALGGHVRVGWEDNPYLPDGSLARNNAELVENVVQLARSIGRPIANSDQARSVIGLQI